MALVPQRPHSSAYAPFSLIHVAPVGVAPLVLATTDWAKGYPTQVGPTDPIPENLIELNTKKVKLFFFWLSCGLRKTKIYRWKEKLGTDTVRKAQMRDGKSPEASSAWFVPKAFLSLVSVKHLSTLFLLMLLPVGFLHLTAQRTLASKAAKKRHINIRSQTVKDKFRSMFSFNLKPGFHFISFLLFFF